MNATPRPWVAVHCTIYKRNWQAGIDHPLAVVRNGPILSEALATAALIVEAVNAYDPLGPEHARQRVAEDVSRLEADVNLLRTCLSIAMKYLYKAEVDGLLQDCVCPVSLAIKRVENLLATSPALQRAVLPIRM